MAESTAERCWSCDWIAGLTCGTGNTVGRMPEPILPTSGLHAAPSERQDDWGLGVHEDGFGLGSPGRCGSCWI